MNAIVVVNIGNHWNAQARRSVECAADRWGCSLKVITTRSSRAAGLHPSWTRLFIGEHVKDYERVLVCDTDILIHWKCPSLFELTSHDPLKMWFVPDYQNTGRRECFRWQKHLDEWNSVMGFNCTPDDQVNGGFYLYSPKHHQRHLDQAVSWWEGELNRYEGLVLWEQFLYAGAAKKFAWPVRLFSTFFNKIRIRDRRPVNSSMDFWVEHLTGSSKMVINNVNWRRLQEPLAWQGIKGLSMGIKGLITEQQVEWLMWKAAFSQHIVELGSWHGRSTCAMAGTTPGTVLALDEWKPCWGSSNDSAFFVQNMHDNMRRKRQGRVVAVVCDHSSVASVTKHVKSVHGDKLDMAFVDGHHEDDAPHRDLITCKKLLVPGGILAAHDYEEQFPAVMLGVDTVMGKKAKKGPGTLRWMVN